jgi:hypothetical protein
MNLQYISDNKGQTTGVFIPIQDWKILKDKLIDIEEDTLFEIPEWHKEIVLERLKKHIENPDDVLDWEEVKDSFKLD